MHSPVPRTKSAFSLVEVSLALAIIGIAFTVIIGMLPVGLRQSRIATDTANEARIMSGMTAIIHATEYDKLTDLQKRVFYFDVDGGFLESELYSPDATSGDAKSGDRIYQAIVIVTEQTQPGESSNYDPLRVSKRAYVVIGRITKAAGATFDQVLSALASDESNVNISDLANKSGIKVIPMVVARMERMRDADIN